LLSLVVLAFATPALAGRAMSASDGGGIAGLERTASRIASSLAGVQVSVNCMDAAGWRELGVTNGFDPALTWAMTPFAPGTGDTARPTGITHLSPRTCRLIDAFAAKPTERGSRICMHGAPLQWSAGKARRTVVAVERPMLGECDDWGAKLVAVHVLGHESMHLAGIVDEATADCLATQVDAYVATRLGANAAFARSLAREYWKIYYPAQDARYRSSECRDGGAMDLFEADEHWPTPTRYPRAVARLITIMAEKSSERSDEGHSFR
jgi:hypothetical protein